MQVDVIAPVHAGVAGKERKGVLHPTERLLDAGSKLVKVIIVLSLFSGEVLSGLVAALDHWLGDSSFEGHSEAEGVCFGVMLIGNNMHIADLIVEGMFSSDKMAIVELWTERAPNLVHHTAGSTQKLVAKSGTFQLVAIEFTLLAHSRHVFNRKVG